MRRLTYNRVKNFYRKEGYKLLSQNYKNANEHLQSICPNNHLYISTYANFKRGTRCQTCTTDSFDDIKKSIEDDGYIFLSSSNLITVCVSCNSLANVNRSWHKAWYQAIMFRRYGYLYSEF